MVWTLESPRGTPRPQPLEGPLRVEDLDDRGDSPTPPRPPTSVDGPFTTPECLLWTSYRYFVKGGDDGRTKGDRLYLFGLPLPPTPYTKRAQGRGLGILSRTFPSEPRVSGSLLGET